MTIDYLKIYDLEGYLFEEVGPRFEKTGKISPADFYMIVIWKANRAKRRIREKLAKLRGSFDSAVTDIAAALTAAPSARERLELLMKEWGFRLPMATAILTVLYPSDFTVYDIRVSQQLKKFGELGDWQFSDRLWQRYQEYLSAVNSAAPKELSLRNKDRYLWGRSFYEGVMSDLKA
jgi:hypothetical protein